MGFFSPPDNQKVTVSLSVEALSLLILGWDTQDKQPSVPTELKPTVFSPCPQLALGLRQFVAGHSTMGLGPSLNQVLGSGNTALCMGIAPEPARFACAV